MLSWPAVSVLPFILKIDPIRLLPHRPSWEPNTHLATDGKQTAQNLNKRVHRNGFLWLLKMNEWINEFIGGKKKNEGRIGRKRWLCKPLITLFGWLELYAHSPWIILLALGPWAPSWCSVSQHTSMWLEDHETSLDLTSQRQNTVKPAKCSDHGGCPCFCPSSNTTLPHKFIKPPQKKPKKNQLFSLFFFVLFLYIFFTQPYLDWLTLPQKNE